MLFNFYLDDFDRALVNPFPYNYARFVNEAVLAIPQQSHPSAEARFSPSPIEQIVNLLRELSLAAKVTLVVPGGRPFPAPTGCYL